MRKIKIFKAKDGKEYMIRIRNEFGTFYIDVDMGEKSFIRLLKSLYKSDEIGKRAFAKCLNGDVQFSSKLVGFPDNGGTEETFNDFVDKVFKVFKRKGELSDPLVISKELYSRASVATENAINFSLKLDDHEVPGAKRLYHFEVGAYLARATEIMGSTNNGLHIATKPEKFNYLSFDVDKVSFCDKMETDLEYWNLPRQTTKVSKVIRKILRIGSVSMHSDVSTLISTPNYTHYQADYTPEQAAASSAYGGMHPEKVPYYLEKCIERAYEILANEFKPKTFVMRTTKDIRKIYGTPNTVYGAGTLGSSCMSAHNISSYECAKQSDFYNYLSDVRILYALGKDKQLAGRALLWNGEFFNAKTKKWEAFKFVDRFYGSEDFVSAGRQWAAERNYWWRQNQSAGEYILVNKSGDTTSIYRSNVSKLPFGEVSRRVPYFDSLKYFNVISRSKHYATLRLTSNSIEGSTKMNGTHASILIVKCENCGTVIVKDNLKSAHASESLYDTKAACTHCSTVFAGKRFIKTKDDVRLTFHGSGSKIMPSAMKDGRLVSIEINGKSILFDAGDKHGIVKYFGKKVKRKKVSVDGISDLEFHERSETIMAGRNRAARRRGANPRQTFSVTENGDIEEVAMPQPEPPIEEPTEGTTVDDMPVEVPITEEPEPVPASTPRRSAIISDADLDTLF